MGQGTHRDQRTYLLYIRSVFLNECQRRLVCRVDQFAGLFVNQLSCSLAVWLFKELFPISRHVKRHLPHGAVHSKLGNLYAERRNCALNDLYREVYLSIGTAGHFLEVILCPSGDLVEEDLLRCSAA